jgi:hypothetical protein
MALKCLAQSIIGFLGIALTFSGCGSSGQTAASVQYQRFVLVEVEQPADGCTAVKPCATVALALDTKTRQVCRAATLHGPNYPLCLRLYEAYPDDRAEIDRLKQIKADETGDWDGSTKEAGRQLS